MNSYTNSLHDERIFFKVFFKDLEQCQKEVIIESPFITSKRIKTLWSALNRAYSRGIKSYIITRDPQDHSKGYEFQSEREISRLEELGIQVFLCTGNHHRKVAIIDREILWEGGGFATDSFNFLNFGRYI